MLTLRTTPRLTTSTAIETCPHNELRHARTNTEWWDGNTDQIWRCLTCEAWLYRSIE